MTYGPAVVQTVYIHNENLFSIAPIDFGISILGVTISGGQSSTKFSATPITLEV